MRSPPQRPAPPADPISAHAPPSLPVAVLLPRRAQQAAALGAHAFGGIDLGHQRGRAHRDEIIEDAAHQLGFNFVDHQQAIGHVVAQRQRPAHPHPLGLAGGDLVADALAGDPVAGPVAGGAARSRLPHGFVARKDPFHLRRGLGRCCCRWMRRCHHRVRLRSMRAAMHNQRHHHGHWIRARRGLRTSRGGGQFATLCEGALHGACDTGGNTSTPSSLKAVRVAGGSSCCRIDW